jgi:CBS domain-containing protein
MANRSMAEIIRRQHPAMLPATASVQEACCLMREQRIGAILVTGQNGALAGLFTGRDAVGRVAAAALDPTVTPLAAVMTARPDAIGPGAHAIEALRMMRDGGYRHLPVVDGSRIVGIVSFGDFEGLERARLDEETGFWEAL